MENTFGAMKTCPTCGGPIVERSIGIVIYEKTINPKTGKRGRRRRVHEQDDECAPVRLVCESCNVEYFPLVRP